MRGIDHGGGIVLAIALVAAGCDRTPEAVLVVDEAHSQVGQPEGREGVKYSVPPVQQLTLDTRSFDFSKALYPTALPNAIQLVIGKDRHYSTPWDPSGLTTLSASTLRPIQDGPAFQGLVAGDQAIVAIGEERFDEAERKLALKVLWVGLVEVKE